MTWPGFGHWMPPLRKLTQSERQVPVHLGVRRSNRSIGGSHVYHGKLFVRVCQVRGQRAFPVPGQLPLFQVQEVERCCLRNVGNSESGNLPMDVRRGLHPELRNLPGKRAVLLQEVRVHNG